MPVVRKVTRIVHLNALELVYKVLFLISLSDVLFLGTSFVLSDHSLSFLNTCITVFFILRTWMCFNLKSIDSAYENAPF